MALAGWSARLRALKRHMPMTLESPVKCTGKSLQGREKEGWGAALHPEHPWLGWHGPEVRWRMEGGSSKGVGR